MFGFESTEPSSVNMVLAQDQGSTCVRCTTTLARSTGLLGEKSKAEYPRSCEGNPVSPVTHGVQLGAGAGAKGGGSLAGLKADGSGMGCFGVAGLDLVCEGWHGGVRRCRYGGGAVPAAGESLGGGGC